MTTTMTATFTLMGTVSHGTLRYQDLIPRFLDALRMLNSPVYDAFVGATFPIIPSDAQFDDSHPWWDSEEARHYLDELFQELEHMAPEYVYFSAHPGDGSDFGFWIDYDAIQEAVVNGEAIFADEIPEDEPQDDITIVFVGNEYDIMSMWKWDGDAWHEVWGT